MENSQHEGNKNNKRAAKRIKTSNRELLEPNRKGSFFFLFFLSGRNNNLVTECQVRPSELQVEQKNFQGRVSASESLFTVNGQNETKIKTCYKYQAYKLSYDEPDKSYQAAGGFIVLQVLLKFLFHGSVRISTAHLTPRLSNS